MKTKKQIRKEIIEKLKKQSKNERKKKSLLIKNKLFDLGEFKEARVIMFYVSTQLEVDTKDMIDDALRMGKKIAVPYISKEERKMVPSLIKNRIKDLAKGPYGIYQPRDEFHTSLPTAEIDMVVVPGIAFTKDGTRLGRGAGFYDRFLSRLPKKTSTIGIAFNLQLVPNLPQKKQDIPVKRLIAA